MRVKTNNSPLRLRLQLFVTRSDFHKHQNTVWYLNNSCAPSSILILKAECKVRIIGINPASCQQHIWIWFLLRLLLIGRPFPLRWLLHGSLYFVLNQWRSNQGLWRPKPKMQHWLLKLGLTIYGWFLDFIKQILLS